MGALVVTVLIPVRNPHVGYLKEALQSLVAQSNENWEAIVIADSDDASLDALELGDPRFRRILNEGERLSGALNSGMRAARASFATILLGDDRLEPSAVEVLADALAAHPTIDFFHSSVRCIDGDGGPVGKVYRSQPARTQKDFLNHVVKHLMCWRIAKSVEIGGIDANLGLHGADDFDFPWSMWEAGATFRNLPETLYVYRIHTNHFRLTTHIPRSVQVAELEKIFRKHRLPEEVIRRELEIRTRGYLSQALFD
jgi:glycosyltransferase involved in cell wall biosynthesis